MNYNLYLFIFILKLLEHSVFAARMSLLTSGQKKFAALLSFPEVAVWAIGTGSVISGFKDDFFLIVPFLLGGQAGMMLGMYLQNLISKRDTVIIGITHEEFCHRTVNNLKENNFGVTILESEDNTKVLVIATKKNRISKARKILRKLNKNASIITNPANPTIGGHVY